MSMPRAAKAKVKAKPKAKSKNQGKTPTKTPTKTKAKLKAKAKPIAKPIAKPKVEARPKAKTKAKPKADVKSQSKANARIKLPTLAKVPGVSIREYQRRRAALMSHMEPGSIAVLPSARTRIRNRDVEFLFRQDSDFYYLTGFIEPNAYLVLTPGRAFGEVVLFCADRDPHWELYNGELLGPDRALDVLGVDDAFPIGDIADILPGMLEGRERIYATLGDYPEFDRQLLSWVKEIRARESGGAIPPGEFVALKHLLHEQRLYKSAAEIGLMREAARITSAAHIRAMRACAPGVNEAQIEAELTHEFMRNGARSPAYPCIVGGGENACVLHYIENSAPLKTNDLLLIDAGCEYHYYAADVTRTFPVRGQFNKTQQAIYEIVLEANLQAIDACQVGASFNTPHEVSLRVMVQGLVDLKLLKGSVEANLESEAFRKFCPHKASHWLGIDVHDVGDYRIDDTWRELEPGMVLTIEPGLYIPNNASTAELAARWRGIGVRIEDDVLITSQGPDVLTAAVPKSVVEVEQIMAGQ